MSKGERRLGKEILKEIKEAGEETGWDVKIETEEDLKEKLNQRSAEKKR